MRPPHLIVDCDPGCDDAVAIAYVLKKANYQRIDFLTVVGNVAVDQTTENTRRVLAACGVTNQGKESAFHLYRGCSRSMMADEPSAASVHGRDGLGETPNSLIQGNDPWLTTESLTAVERLLELGRNQREQFDLLCTGPLTNLATAFSLMRPEQRHSFFGRCRGFIVMGGVFNSLGNISHSAEFNLFADPAAAQIVLTILKQQRSGHPNETPEMHFVSLDATEQVGIRVDHKAWNKNAKDTTPADHFLRYALQQYGQFHVLSSATRPTGAGILPFKDLEYVRSMLAGSSGASELQPFCYLHDALAGWALVQGLADLKCWNKAEIRMDTSRGESRGRVIVCACDKEHGPVGFPSLGTRVKWLNLTAQNKRRFLSDIRNVLGISDPARRSSRP